MRLLVLSQYFWPENFRVNELVTAMAQRGHEITVLTGVPNYPDGSTFSEYRANPFEFGAYGTVPVVRVPIVPRGRGSVRLVLNYLSFVVAGATLGVWRLRKRRFDAVLVYQPSPITACLPAILIGRFKKAPVLLWTLDLWPETLQAVGAVRSKWLLAAVGRVVSFIYQRCALILGPSRSFESSVTRHSTAPGKFRYFPQWSESAPEQPADPPSELRRFSNSFNVMFAGNVGEAQDFPAILDAAERLRDHATVRWLIVGDGRAAGWVREEVMRRDLTERVYLLGRYPADRMPSLFCAAHALLVTLKNEPVFALTIPAKVQTYLVAGLPILGMLDGEGARVIGEAGAGLISPAGDSAALAANVEKLAAMSSKQRTAMGVRGIAYAQREFDRDSLLAQLEGWIDEVAGRNQ